MAEITADDTARLRAILEIILVQKIKVSVDIAAAMELQELSPEWDEWLTWLDVTREEGEFNMYEVAPHLAEQFGLDVDFARAVLVYWMQVRERREEVNRE